MEPRKSTVTVTLRRNTVGSTHTIGDTVSGYGRICQRYGNTQMLYRHRWVPGKLLFGARAGYVAGERYFSPLEHGHSQGSLEEGGGGEPAGDCLLTTQDLPQQEVLEATTTG